MRSFGALYEPPGSRRKCSEQLRSSSIDGSCQMVRTGTMKLKKGQHVFRFRDRFVNALLLINDFLESKGLNLNKISEIYVNRGPGSFAGIRNSLSIVKAFHLVKKIDYYCFSFVEFEGENNVKYENIPLI